MKWNSPFHEGELQAQRLAGEAASAQSNSAMISDKIPGGALNFLRQQSMVTASTRDSDGHRWASILFGRPGFLEPSDRLTLRISIPAERRDSNDPLWRNLTASPRVGLLVIDLETRRRIRINGNAGVNDEEMVVSITESFPICPKYITRRNVKVVSTETAAQKDAVTSGVILPKQPQDRIRTADVLLLATGHAERGNDASHRGGNPGFVEVVDAKTLRIADFPGNGMFNALGNVLADENLGLLFPFFKEGRQLQITATAKVLWDQPDPEGKTGGTNRIVELAIDRWLERALPAVVRTGQPEPSPYNP